MKSIICGFCCMAAVGAVALSGCGHADRENPFMKPFDTPYGIPPFEEIQISDYEPAFDAGIKEAQASIDSIVSNPEAPTFENTILPLDCLSPTLERVSSVLFALTEADSSPELTEVSEKLLPRYSAFSDEMMMNDKLFKRIETLYNNIDTAAQPLDERRAITDAYNQFVLRGALLSDDKKAQLKTVNNRLTELYLKFNKNLLKANNTFEIVVDKKEDLAGLPKSTIDNAAAEAKSRGKEGKWVFTLHAPSRLAVLQHADNRELREKMWKGYTTNATAADYDNRPVIKEIVANRAEKARLLGFPTFAALMTADKMAKTPEAAEELLMKIFEPAKAKVAQEVATMQKLSNDMGNTFTIEPWDYYYFAEKVRQRDFSLNESEIRPYFAVDSVRKGIFAMANRLYGLTFEEMPDAPKYHPDVKVYDVKDSEGRHHGSTPTVRLNVPSSTMSATSHLPRPMLLLCSPSTTCRPCSTNSATLFTACSLRCA